MQSYEVEIKSLLGNSERAEEVRRAMKSLDPKCVIESQNKQLNHYFEGGTLRDLVRVLTAHLSGVAEIKLDNFAEHAKDFSVRSREKNGTVYLVVKASMGNDTSANGVARMELEEKLPLSLKQLDDLILSTSFRYQAKWSREREEYLCQNVNVCLDKNAGYGWLAEFERVVDHPTKIDDARKEVRSLMNTLGVTELPQERLERMFAFYNKHWQEYYGTDKVFDVE